MSGQYFKSKLTPMQEVFVSEYLKCGDPVESAKRAKYKDAHYVGPRLLSNNAIYMAIKRGRSEMGID